MQNKNIVIGLLVLLLILVGVALVNKDKFSPSQQTTAVEVQEPSPTAVAMQQEAASPAAMQQQTTMMKAEVTSTTSAKTLTLTTQNGSGQSGTATLAETNGKVVVTLSMNGGTFTAPQPAHIHTGSCPTPGSVVYPLSNVVNGKSVTTLDVSMSELTAKEPLAINVHKSAAEVQVYTACGDLK